MVYFRRTDKFVVTTIEEDKQEKEFSKEQIGVL